MPNIGAGGQVGFQPAPIQVRTPVNPERAGGQPAPAKTATPEQRRLYNQANTRAGLPAENRLRAMHAAAQNEKKAAAEGQDQPAAGTEGGSSMLSKVGTAANVVSAALSIAGKGMQLAGVAGTVTAVGAPIGLPTIVLGEAVNIAATVAGLVGTGAKVTQQLMAGDVSGAKKSMAQGGVLAAATMI